jgi:hypothetical protein
MKVDHEDDVAVGGEEFGVPAIGPVVSPGALWPAVNEEFDGILLVGIEVGRADEQSFNVIVVSTFERKASYFSMLICASTERLI